MAYLPLTWKFEMKWSAVNGLETYLGWHDYTNFVWQL